jgi:hypothetical protein
MIATLEPWKQRADSGGFSSQDVLTRLEQARNLLLNPHYRVSEIAAHSGFESSEEFEREFFRGTGGSVWGYRETLANSLHWNVEHLKQTPGCGMPQRDVIHGRKLPVASVAARKTWRWSVPIELPQRTTSIR